MKLDRLILVNWGQIRPGDYELGNMNLLTGPTGAGKSTMLDGLQTIMTAAYQGIVAYNPGQEEVTQGQRRGKSKRTLESFVVGAEYSRFSRPFGAQGYVAAAFRPEPDEVTAQPFTALVAASARVDGTGERREPKLERLVLVIVEDATLTAEDFFDDYEQGVCVPVEEVARRLRAKYPKVHLYDDHKRDYLCGLYGRFRGRNSIPWDEAQNAAKAWSQSIAYKPIGSVHDLVRDDILEFDGKALQESITRISDLMRQVTNLKHEGKRLESTVTRLRDMKDAIAKTAAAFEDQVHHDLLLAKLAVVMDAERIEAEQQAIVQSRAEIEKSQRLMETETQLKSRLDSSRIRVAAQLSGIPAYSNKKSLSERLEAATTGARNKLIELRMGLLSAAQLKNAADGLMKQPIPEAFPRLRSSVDAVARAVSRTGVERLAGLLDAVADASGDDELSVEKLTQLATAFDSAEAGLDELLTSLTGADQSVLTALASEAATVDQRVEAATKERKELADRKQRLSTGAGNYPREVTIALDRIKERLPQAGVQVLCDLVEPASQEWQAAIEAYMDGSRFILFVKPEWEAKSIDFLKSSGARARIAQGKRCMERADPKRVAPNSIIQELRTEHPIAKAYLMEQFGSVVKVADAEELRFTPRGLTIDGKGSGSNSMFVCESRDFVLGRKAREQALERVTAQLSQLDRDIIELDGQQRLLADFRRAVGHLRIPTFDAASLARYAADIESTRLDLRQLDLTQAAELEKEELRLKGLINRHDETIRESQRVAFVAEERIKAAERTIASINAGRDAHFERRDEQIQRLKRLCEVNPEKTYTVLAQRVDEDLQSRRFDLAALQARVHEVKGLPEKLLGDVRELLAEYNATARQDALFQAALPHLPDTSRFDPYYGPLVELGRSVGKLHVELESIGLYNNRAKVEEAERSFHDVFTKQFCVEIKSKVDEGVRTLRHLNRELEKLKFGTDKFTIDWSNWEPEFKDYYGFFSEVALLADSPETVDLFGETELSAKHLEVRDRLVRLLLDADQDRASRELLRIADYRNYRRYEIWNDSESGGRTALSTWGTGSGGQLETPAYIVRAAVVTNRMKLFEKGASLKLMVSDESFSKMDEARAKAVLQYLRDGLGLQLICAMPTRNAGGLRPEFDREYSYSRVHVPQNGELDFILETDERIFKPDRMRELWNKQREQIREQARLSFDASEPEALRENPA